MSFMMLGSNLWANESRVIIQRFEREGWYRTSVAGSDYQYVHPDKPGKVTVKHPQKYVPVFDLRNTFRQAGWDWRTRR